ncbi:MAG TPA: hypothetical protein VD887_03040 [Allosphingosinicella sp.]|nr:hypothetical protein [Allosphingosinicella sp.]
MTEASKAGAISRRSLLAVMSAATIGTAAQATPLRRARAAPAAARGDLGRAGIESWRPLVGERFSLAGAPGAPLKLVAVEPLSSPGRRPASVSRRRGFAAIFEGSAARAPEGDATYWLSHSSSGPLPVHFGTKAADGGKARLVAIFN